MSESASDLLITQKAISFQDMQSICKSFKEYLGVTIPIDKNVENIIVGQACRHTIVHSHSTADFKYMNQIRDCKKSEILNGVKFGETISIQPKEIEVLMDSMKSYVRDIIIGINSKISVER